MTLKEVTTAEAIEAITRGADVCAMYKINMDSTLRQLNDAFSFCMYVDDDPVEEPEEEPEEESEEDKELVRNFMEKTNPKPKTKIDHGKVYALHRAGWSNPKIAEEMKCSDQQVRNIIKKMDFLLKNERPECVAPQPESKSE